MKNTQAEVNIEEIGEREKEEKAHKEEEEYTRR